MTEKQSADIKELEKLREFFKRTKFLSEIFELWTQDKGCDTMTICMTECLLYNVRKFEGKKGFYDV